MEAINLTVNLLAGFQLLLHSDQELDTINDHLDQLDLGETKTISVGNVENLINVRLVLTIQSLFVTYATLGSGIDTTGTTLLKSELSQDLVEASVLGEVDQFAVDTGADTSS